MAHIASCILDTDPDDLSSGLNNYVAKAVSAQDSNESLGRASPLGDKPFAWRLQHPERKYQLFPRDKQVVTAPGKALDPEQAFALAMGQNGDKTEKVGAVTGLRIRIKEHNLVRRRKISVPDLGPMTTVQEAAMDSPTIPGRPPIHERSISAPGNSWKPYSLAECMTSARPQPAAERIEPRSACIRSNEEPQRPQNEVRQPMSPKSLAPLVIPTCNSAAPRLAQQASLNRLRSGSTPVESVCRSARLEDSPRARTPFTPLSASLATPRSGATTVATVSTMPTPVSAPVGHRASPKPWERPAAPGAAATPDGSHPGTSLTPQSELGDPIQTATLGHRRYQSESGSIMERGRPRKRSDICAAAAHKRTGSKRSKSSERRAFEQLPKGWKASDAANVLCPQEVASLQKQALQQAARFEVLRKEDVDSLSRELRQLDERTEYLRLTYTSLRAGRRNLHSRIFQYLRSPRTATFSPESILKQEESLAEFDNSIEEWVNKLEQVENRRTRVRQKLLEHVAAAATLGLPAENVLGVSESLHHAIGVRPLNANNLSTPPRSPAKSSFTATQSSSPSPHRAQVPSTILEQPMFEDAASMDTKDSGAALRRAETIRVYADNDVYSLLARVQDSIDEMTACGEAAAAHKDSSSSSSSSLTTSSARAKLCRTRSHDALTSSPARYPVPTPDKLDKKPSSSSLTASAAAIPEAAAAAAEPAAELFLTSAVFKPPQ
ncbi:hypothetical protein N658DRAFT_418674 [Parathielavia hyrcaniae]|uniref:Up-regulated during septation protein 1 domain-containing protein n=1 Tax=Parathielavia hyrcaniae TaxID=113614 RepID=A0AAN6Q6W5_9PEZI|nr:hypothetical protein N658DRAFT_418674 [Parathielavia hyrcaniae]